MTGKTGGVFLLVFVAIFVGKLFLFQNKNAVIDMAAKSYFSEEDYKALKDPAAANKAYYEKLGREGWQRSQQQMPQINWDRGWKK
jgi:hypothetical protein